MQQSSEPPPPLSETVRRILETTDAGLGGHADTLWVQVERVLQNAPAEALPVVQSFSHSQDAESRRLAAIMLGHLWLEDKCGVEEALVRLSKDAERVVAREALDTLDERCRDESLPLDEVLRLRGHFVQPN